jgi:hypothetical protein
MSGVGSVRLFALWILALSLAGCQSMGPGAIKAGRAQYNAAINQTNNEQLLLNLVRLRYRDTPYFLEVSAVNTQLVASAGGGASAGWGRIWPNSSTRSLSSDTGSVSETRSRTKSRDLGISADIGFEEKPNITYQPLSGEQFVVQMMSPVALDTILLLNHSGWSIERIMRVTLQAANGVLNAPGASGPTPDYVPEHERFARVAKLLRGFQRERKLWIGKVPGNGREDVVMFIARDGSPERNELCRLLNIDPMRERYTLTTGVLSRDPGAIAVIPRSVMAMMFYLSQSVDVPEEHAESGRVTRTLRADGNELDWQEVIGSLMDIKVSADPPAEAFVSTRYRDYWFYIDDRDRDSKSTFSLLRQLIALQGGEIKGNAPVLTLPVGG